MDDAAIELVESMRWCDVRLVGFAWIEAGKSVLLTLRLLPDERKAYLLCRWAELVKIDLEFGDRDGGSPFSWEGEVKRDAQGRWELSFDFASTGGVSLRCSELEFLRAPPDDGDDPLPERWVVTWTFHLSTEAARDAERVFAKVSTRVGSAVRVIDSGPREARPGTWVRGELELIGSFGDAIAATLEEAGTFGSDIGVSPPEQYVDGSVSLRGWIHRCSHSELSAVGFELRNRASCERMSSASKTSRMYAPTSSPRASARCSQKSRLRWRRSRRCSGRCASIVERLPGG